jgi:hypothetical protein
LNTIAVVDTTVLCRFLGVRDSTEEQEAIRKSYLERIEADERMFLPLAAILETGNHIGKMADGNLRRRCAVKLRDLVQKARQVPAAVPLLPLGDWRDEDIDSFLAQFPDWVGKVSGLGDLAIHHDWEKLCKANAGRRVYIWTLDKHLAAFDRGPAV